jgi:DNA polymerase (family 10)
VWKVAIDRKTASRTLREIADLLEIHGDNAHRVRAFANAARAVERVEGDLGEMITSGEILQIRGVGRGTAAVLEEIAAGRRPVALVEVEDKIPAGVRDLLAIAGLGPKKVRALWRDLGVTNIGELEYACRENRLVDLAGFGAKSQEKLLEAITFAQRSAERRLLHQAWSEAVDFRAALEGRPGVEAITVAGEVRRRCETVGGVDLAVTSANEETVAETLRGVIPAVERVSPGVWSGVTDRGTVVRIRVASPPASAVALVWATGSAGHMHALGQRAEAMGLRLREDGLWMGDNRVSCEGEKEFYEALGCQWVPPELREDGPEVDAAAAGRLPELVDVDDLRGVLHNHTTDSDGVASVEAMAAAANGHGWTFFGVADHSPVVKYANGVDAERLRDQWFRIDEINRSGDGVRVIKGLEADILSDGGLDIPEGCEDGLEYVVASVHTGFRLTSEEQTDRIVRAVAHPACRVLGHPTGRLLLARPPYAVDVEQVLVACAEHGVAAEINSSPYRLDLGWRWAKRALELGVKLVVNPDAHSLSGLDDVRWGVAIARKAGATSADLVNSAP